MGRSGAGPLQFGPQQYSRSAQMVRGRHAATHAPGRICDVLACANAAPDGAKRGWRRGAWRVPKEISRECNDGCRGSIVCGRCDGARETAERGGWAGCLRENFAEIGSAVAECAGARKVR